MKLREGFGMEWDGHGHGYGLRWPEVSWRNRKEIKAKIEYVEICVPVLSVRSSRKEMLPTTPSRWVASSPPSPSSSSSLCVLKKAEKNLFFFDSKKKKIKESPRMVDGGAGRAPRLKNPSNK